MINRFPTDPDFDESSGDLFEELDFSRFDCESVGRESTPSCRWFLPQPFEPRYAYPVLVLLTQTPVDQATAWADAIGRQNVAVVAVCLPKRDQQGFTSADVALCKAHALLMKPSSLSIREDRLYLAGHAEAADAAVTGWLDPSLGVSGAAAIAPTRVPASPVGSSGRVRGQLLVTNAIKWRRPSLALHAAGATVELRPALRDLPTTGATIENWIMRAIPTALGTV